jgi:hypothetical protein
MIRSLGAFLLLCSSAFGEPIEFDALKKATSYEVPASINVTETLAVGGKRYVVAGHCDDNGKCAAHVTEKDEHENVIRDVPLTVPRNLRIDANEGYDLRSPVLKDLDGDGTPELLVRFGFSTPPRAAVGSWSYEYLVVFKLPELVPEWTHLLFEGGGGSAEDVCQWTIDATHQAGVPALNATTACQYKHCWNADTADEQPPCPKAPRSATEKYVWSKNARRFQLVGKKANVPLHREGGSHS